MTEKILRIGAQEKDRIARGFLRGRSTYDDEAIVQRKVNERLLGLLVKQERTDYRNILEIGCCTGMLTELLCKHFKPSQLYINDLVPEFYDTVSKKLNNSAQPSITPCFGDIEKQKLPGDLDLVISSSTLQWLDDLGGFFNRISSSLSEQGILAFSMFGQETFSEVTELTGTGLHYPAFDTVVGLVGERFKIRYKGVEREHLFFSRPEKILRHIQATGVTGVGGYAWTPRRFETFVREYRRRFATSRGLPLSYVSYTILAEKVSS